MSLKCIRNHMLEFPAVGFFAVTVKPFWTLVVSAHNYAKNSRESHSPNSELGPLLMLQEVMQSCKSSTKYWHHVRHLAAMSNQHVFVQFLLAFGRPPPKLFCLTLCKLPRIAVAQTPTDIPCNLVGEILLKMTQKRWVGKITLPETNSKSLWKWGIPKGDSSSNHWFSGAKMLLLVSGKIFLVTWGERLRFSGSRADFSATHFPLLLGGASIPRQASNDRSKTSKRQISKHLLCLMRSNSYI